MGAVARRRRSTTSTRSSCRRGAGAGCSSPTAGSAATRPRSATRSSRRAPSLAPVRHETEEVAYVVSGSGELRLDDEPVPFREGDALAHPGRRLARRREHRRRGRRDGLRLPASRLPADGAPLMVGDRPDAARAGRLGLPDPRRRGLRRPHARPRQRARRRTATIWIKRKGVALDEVEPGRRGRARRHRRRRCTSRRCCTPGVYARGPTSERSSTATRRTRPRSARPTRELELLTHDGILFADGVGALRRRRDLIVDDGAGRRRSRRRSARGGPCCCSNHGVLVVGKDVPWAVLDGGDARARGAAAVDRRDARRAAADRARELARRCCADQVPDEFVDEYWAAWQRAASAARRRRPRVEISRLASTAREVVRDVEPQELLLDFLRDSLGLTGAKRSCDVQVCGACTVLVDGRPVSSCCFLAADADGREVTDDRGSRRAARVRAARGGVHPPRRAAVRLLHAGDAAHGQPRCSRAASSTSEEEIKREPRRQPLPLHRLPRHRRGGRRAGRGRHDGDCRGTGRPDAGRRLRTRAGTRARSSAARRSSSGDMLVPRMLHGKVLRSPIAHAPHRLHRHVARPSAIPGVVCVLTGADLADIDPYYGHAIKDRPIVAIDKVRFHGEPVAAVAAETTAAAAAAVDAIAVEYEELPGGRERRRGGRRRRAARHRRARCARASSTASASCPPRDGNVCYRYRHRPRRARGRLRARRHRRRGRVHVPRRLPVRDGDAHGDRPGRGRRDHAVGDLPAPVPRARRDRRPLRRPGRERAHQVPYLGGGFGSKSYTKMEPLTVALARKAGRPVRIQNRVGESMVTTRRHDMRCRMRTAATSRRAPARTRGRVPGSTPAPTPTTGRASSRRRATPRRGRTAGRRTASTPSCVYTNLAPAGLLPRLRRDAPAVDRRVAGRRDRAPRRARPARGAAPEPAARRARRCAPAASRSTPISSATSRRSRRPSAGTSRSRRSSVAASRSACSPPGRTRSRARSAGSRPTAASSCSSARPRWARARAPRSRRSPPRSCGVEPDRVTVRGADTRFTPYDRSTGASRSTTIAGLAVQRAAADIRQQLERDRRHRRDRPGRLPRPDAQALRLRRRRADRPRRGRPGRHRLVRRGPGLLGGLRRRRRGRGRPGHGLRPRARARRPSPTSAGRSTRSSSSGRTRARRCRASATRSSRRWSTRTACSSTTRCSTTACRASRTCRAR